MVTYDHKIQFVTLYTETLDFNVVFAKKLYFCPHQQWRRCCLDNSISLWSKYSPVVSTNFYSIHHHYQGSIDFNTVITKCPRGRYFLKHPKGCVNDERMAVHCLELGCIGLYNVHLLRPQDFPRPSRGNSGFALGTSLGGSGNLLVVGDVQLYNPIHPSSQQCTYTMLLCRRGRGTMFEQHIVQCGNTILARYGLEFDDLS